MQLTNQKLKIYSILGAVGGVLFMIGDCLIYCYEGLGISGVQPMWAEMPEWRFVLSAVLGFMGMALMLPAGLRQYRTKRRTCLTCILFRHIVQKFLDLRQ